MSSTKHGNAGGAGWFWSLFSKNKSAKDASPDASGKSNPSDVPKLRSSPISINDGPDFDGTTKTLTDKSAESNISTPAAKGWFNFRKPKFLSTFLGTTSATKNATTNKSTSLSSAFKNSQNIADWDIENPPSQSNPQDLRQENADLE